jgi:hypothetical protein
MVKMVEVKYTEGAVEIFSRYALAAIEIGDNLDEPIVLDGGKERRDLEGMIRDGDVAKAMRQLEGKYTYKSIVWVCAGDENNTLLFLLPTAIGVYGSKQVLIGHVCHKCGCISGMAAICGSKEPWNCYHSEIVYCVNCGAESGVVGGIHGGSGSVLSDGEIEGLSRIEADDDE